MAPDVTIEEFYNIQLYLEYQRVCPFVRIGSPHPFYRKRLCLPPPRNQKGVGRQHLLAGEGAGGANSDDWRESLVLCLQYSAYVTIGGLINDGYWVLLLRYKLVIA